MPDHRPALELLARLGYAARGLVNLLIGLLALAGAWGGGGGAADSKGALQTLLSQPWGWALLGLVAIGLFGFALWRALQALLDADHRGHDAHAMVARAANLVSAITYGGLGVTATAMVLGEATGGGTDWTGWLMRQPGGRWLLGAGGLAVIGAGLAMLRRAARDRFTRHLACDDRVRRWIIPFGRLGFGARGFVLGLVGLFVVLAAWHASPEEARGLGGALLALQQQPFGRIGLAVVAFGMMAFGFYGFAEARYRRIDPPG